MLYIMLKNDPVVVVNIDASGQMTDVSKRI